MLPIWKSEPIIYKHPTPQFSGNEKLKNDLNNGNIETRSHQNVQFDPDVTRTCNLLIFFCFNCSQTRYYCATVSYLLLHENESIISLIHYLELNNFLESVTRDILNVQVHSPAFVRFKVASESKPL